MALIYDGDNFSDSVTQTSYDDYDEIYTYGGNDSIRLRYTYTDVEAGSGADRVTSIIEGHNRIWLGTGNDTYTSTGYSHDDSSYDIVRGGDGNDTFNISTAISIYYGDSGNDTFNSVGFWNDYYGGSGRDTISYLRQDSDPDLKGAGVKIDLDEGYATSGGGREEGLYSIEDAKGSSYDDTILATDSTNRLWGNGGDDVLKGYGGNDTLYGGFGDDDLYGGASRDKLYGGRGNDIMQGGSSADIFVFETRFDSVKGTDRDVIEDFSRSEGDRLDVSRIDAIVGNSGKDDFDYIGSAAFSGDAGELRFRNGYVQADVNGDRVADFEIRLSGGISTLSQSDFIL